MCKNDKFTCFCVKKIFKVAIGLILSVFALLSSLSCVIYFGIVLENQKIADNFPIIDKRIITVSSLYILSFVLIASSSVITFKTCQGFTEYFKTVEEDSILEEPNLSRLLIFVFTLLCLSWMVLLYISILFFDLDFKESSNENIIYAYYATLLLSHVILFILFWKLMSYNVDVVKKEETREISMVMENSNHRQTRYWNIHYAQQLIYARQIIIVVICTWNAILTHWCIMISHLNHILLITLTKPFKKKSANVIKYSLNHRKTIIK